MNAHLSWYHRSIGIFLYSCRLPGKLRYFILVGVSRFGNKGNIASILEQEQERSMGRIGEVGVIK